MKTYDEIDVIITNKKIMDSIYGAATDNNIADNWIESKELRNLYDKFIEKYTDDKDIDGQNEFLDDLNEVTVGFQRRSFDVGFKAAVSLLTGAECCIHGKGYAV